MSTTLQVVLGFLLLLGPHTTDETELVPRSFLQSGDGWGAIANWMAAYMNDLIIEGLRAVTTTFWYLEKIAAGIARFLTEEDMWSLILDSAITSLSQAMPTILQGLIFSNNGAGGLIYLAFFLAGLLMIIPNAGHARLVDPTRVITWAVIVTTLFLSASAPWGYDLIGLVEQMRAGAVQIVIGTVTNSSNLDALVAQPMRATDADLSNYSFVLPGNFEQEYLPAASNFDTSTIVFIDSPFFTWDMKFEIESPSSQQQRRQKAETALAISGLTLVPAGVLLMFGFIFATLAASALILIVFFLVSLPLGFFEFGSAILNGIIKQYVYLWAVTLLAVILPGILVGAGSLAYPSTGAPSPEQIMAFIPILIIVAIGTSYVSAMATNAMTDTFSIISTSIRTSMASLNYAGSMPQGGMLGGGPLSGATNIAATAALAAATGGASAALMAGAGSMIGNISQGGGQAAGQLASATLGERANVFASAARSSGPARVASVAGRQRRQKKQKREKASAAAQAHFKKQVGKPDDLPTEEWGVLSAGNYLTIHQGDLDKAEHAYRRGQHTTARHHLTRAFGSREVANEVIQHYEEHGEQGMRQVRHYVNTTQDMAYRQTVSGQPLFDGKGQMTPTFRKRIWAGLKTSKGFDPTNKKEAALAAHIAGATVRQATPIWDDPLATLKLARHVEDPNNSEIITPDQAALYRLQDLAVANEWGETQLEALFEATNEGRAVALHGKLTGIEAVVQRLNMHGEFAYTDHTTRREAARLALLVTEQASTQCATEKETPNETIKTHQTPTRPMAAVKMNANGTSTNGASTNGTSTNGTSTNGTSTNVPTAVAASVATTGHMPTSNTPAASHPSPESVTSATNNTAAPNAAPVASHKTVATNNTVVTVNNTATPAAPNGPPSAIPAAPNGPPSAIPAAPNGPSSTMPAASNTTENSAVPAAPNGPSNATPAAPNGPSSATPAAPNGPSSATPAAPNGPPSAIPVASNTTASTAVPAAPNGPPSAIPVASNTTASTAVPAAPNGPPPAVLATNNTAVTANNTPVAAAVAAKGVTKNSVVGSKLTRAAPDDAFDTDQEGWSDNQPQNENTHEPSPISDTPNEKDDQELVNNEAPIESPPPPGAVEGA